MDAQWNEKALQGVFVKRLNEQLRDEQAAQDDSSVLKGFCVSVSPLKLEV